MARALGIGTISRELRYNNEAIKSKIENLYVWKK